MKKIISVFMAFLLASLALVTTYAIDDPLDGIMVDFWPLEEHTFFPGSVTPCFVNAIDENGQLKEDCGGIYYFCRVTNKFFDINSKECPYCHNKAHILYYDWGDAYLYTFECASHVEVSFVNYCQDCFRVRTNYSKKTLIANAYINGERTCDCGRLQTTEKNIIKKISHCWQTSRYILKYTNGVCTDWHADDEVEKKDAYFAQFTISEKTAEEIEAEKAAEETKPEPQKGESIWDKIVAFFKRIGEFIVNIFTF